MSNNNFDVDNIKDFLDEATAEGLLKPGEAEAMEITFLAIARIAGKAGVFIIKSIIKLLKKAGVELKKLKI
jgi:hypothetical protein